MYLLVYLPEQISNKLLNVSFIFSCSAKVISANNVDKHNAKILIAASITTLTVM